MYKPLTAIAVAAIVTIATVAAPDLAEARRGRIAAGIIGGIAAGAIIGSIAASNRYYYGPGYYYGSGYYGPGYYEPGPYAYEPAPVYVPRGNYGYTYDGSGSGECWPCY
ncbi:MAG TPA: hypothetical protein VIV34_11830 [Pseudolabrys sp.]